MDDDASRGSVFSDDTNVVYPDWQAPTTTPASTQMSTTSSARSRDLPREAKLLKIGLLLIILLDALISSAAIIVTQWYAGISIAAAVSMMFVGVILLLMAYGNIGFVENGSYCGRVTFIFTMAAVLCAILLGIYSILIQVQLMQADARPWCVIAVCFAFLLHFVFSLRTAWRITRNIKHKIDPSEEPEKPLASPEMTELSSGSY